MNRRIISLLEKYNNLSIQVKASLWFTISNVLQKGVALLSTPIFTRILTQEQYGIYSQYHSWVGIVTIFATLNLFMGNYNKGLIEFEDDKEAYTSSVLSLTTFITLVTFCIFFLSINFWSETLSISPTLIMLMFVEILVLTPFEFWIAKEKFQYRYKETFIVSFVMSIFSLVFSIIAVLISPINKIEARVIADVIIKGFIGISIFIILLKKGKTIFRKKYWVYALGFNIPLIPHFLSNLILNQADRLMIGKMIGDAEVAKYSVAYTISMMMLLITNAINNAYIPFTYKSVKQKSVDKLYSNTSYIAFFVCILCICTVIVGPEIIKVFAGLEYYDAIYIVPPVAVSVFFIFLYTLFSNIEYYFKKTKWISLASFICALANVILNYFFIKLFGYIAAGYTTLVCYLGLALAHYVFYKKIIKEQFDNIDIYNIKHLFLTSILLLIFMILVTFTYKFFVIRYGLIIFILILLILNKEKIIKVLSSIKKKGD